MLTQLMFHLVFPETILNLVACAPKVGKNDLFLYYKNKETFSKAKTGQ